MSRVRLDYDEFKDRLPGELSGGQRQRVAIARALIADPGVLILDEPTSMLDYDVKVEIMDILRHLAANNDYAILLISHDIGFIRDICTYISVMECGQIIEEGNPDEIYNSPKKELTKKLVLASQDLQKYFAEYPYKN
jgi:ABC-type glutathione transport system ATPase component